VQPPTIKCAHVHLVKVSVLMNISFFFYHEGLWICTFMCVSVHFAHDATLS